MLKVLFAGTPDVAVPSLKLLAQDTEHFEVVAVLTRPDAPTGRGRKLVANPVKQAALELGLPVIESDPSEETFVSELAATGAQAAAVVAYGKILKQDVLDALPMGWYNLHFSLLPQWRGAAPVQRSIWAGEKVTGATVFRIVRAWMPARFWRNPPWKSARTRPPENCWDVWPKTARICSQPRCRRWPMIRSHRWNSLPERMRSRRRSPWRTRISASTCRYSPPTARFAHARRIRDWCELHAHADAEPATLHVLRAQPADISNPNAPASLEPGHIVAGKKNVWVGTSTEPLELLEVKAQGKKAMRAADWARGAHLDNAFCE